MAWTSVKTWGGSEVLTSADMNTYVSTNTDYLYDNMATANQWMGQGTSIAQLNQRIESGTCWMAITTSNYGTIAQTFNTAFGSVPRIICSTFSNVMVPAAGDRGTAGFTFWLTRGSAGTSTGTYEGAWLAIGA